MTPSVVPHGLGALIGVPYRKDVTDCLWATFAGLELVGFGVVKLTDLERWKKIGTAADGRFLRVGDVIHTDDGVTEGVGAVVIQSPPMVLTSIAPKGRHPGGSRLMRADRMQHVVGVFRRPTP